MKIRTSSSRSNSSATPDVPAQAGDDLQLVGEIGVGGAVGLPTLDGAAQTLRRTLRQRGQRYRLLEDQLVQRERAARRASA